MPYLKIQTNVPVEDSAKSDILRAASRLLAKELGKPESYVMVHLQAGQDLLFAGGGDAAAFVELKSLGLPEDKAPRLSSMICSLLKESLNIDPRRIYIEMSSHPANLWGWNGETFG
ncbi:MAG: phenylpyruvate tautomerase MIF-related protein [Methylacidiphilales bacterium]|nr:phenylpyruvate tautomerase MIF-related protein [Candidatus Methylacidiphilales bacterium]